MAHSSAAGTGGQSGPAFETFIISSSLEKPDPKTRKFIRSYVMRGKNKKRPKGRGWRDDQVHEENTVPDKYHTSATLLDDQELVMVPSQSFYDEFSLLGFGDDLQPYMKGLIHQAFTVVKPATHTVRNLLVGYQNDDFYCVGRLSEHPAMTHTVIFTAQAFYDRAMGLSYGRTANFHLEKTIKYLQATLYDPSQATSNSTLAVVTSLAMAAILLGELETAAKHMDGLARIVELRGGFKSLGKGAIMEHKARSIDLGLAIGTGSETRFPQTPSWDASITRRNFASRFPELNAVQLPFDQKLASIWADLRSFSLAADAALATGVKIPVQSFTNISESVPHRLLGLRYGQSSLHELLRLSMTAYVKTILIRIKGIGPRMSFLAERLRGALLLHLGAASPAQLPFLLWALFITAVSIFEGCWEDWLRRALVRTMSALGLRTWPETREVLGAFLWTDVLHKAEGKEVFEQCFRREPPTEVNLRDINLGFVRSSAVPGFQLY